MQGGSVLTGVWRCFCHFGHVVRYRGIDMAQGADMIMNRFADGICMVIHGQIFIQCDAKNFCMVSQWDLRASNVNCGETGVAVGTLASVE